MNFCDLKRSRGKTALLQPKIVQTDLQSPRKTAPVRRLTVNRKPLSTASRLHFHQHSPSLAQPPMPRNGLYSSWSIFLRSIDFRASTGHHARNSGFVMPDRRYRVLAVSAHPVQYMSPIFRRMAAYPALDLHVAYCSLRGAEAGHDPEFGATIQWDVPLLDGYSWSKVPNRGSGGDSFFGLRNPGLWKMIRNGNYDAILCFTTHLNATFWIAYFAGKFLAASLR